MKKYVRYLCPGTFCAEDVLVEVEDFNVQWAVDHAKTIKVRHSATPYAFYFVKGTKISSPKYFLGGKIVSLTELKFRNDPDDKILIRNMEINNKDKIIVNDNSYRWSEFLESDFVILQYNQEQP